MIIEPMAIIELGDKEGGYLVPKYIWTRRPGPTAWLYRTMGRIFGVYDWLQKGMIKNDFAAELEALIKREKAIEEKLSLSK